MLLLVQLDVKNFLLNYMKYLTTNVHNQNTITYLIRMFAFLTNGEKGLTFLYLIQVLLLHYLALCVSLRLTRLKTW